THVSPDIAREGDVDLRRWGSVEAKLVDVPHHAHDRARHRLAEVGASLNRLVKCQLATDWILTRPEGPRKGFVHDHSGTRGEVVLRELASRTERDAHGVEIARRDGHEPHLRIVFRIRGATHDVDGRR